MAMSEWEWAPGTSQDHVDRITRFHMDSLAVPVEQRIRPSDPGRHDFPIGLDENGRKFPVPPQLPTWADRVLGCVTYGFNRHYDAAAGRFDPVTPVAPNSRRRASDHFVDTLRTDPTTTSYSFEPAPGFIECGNAGDFPLPQGDTRIA